MKNQTEKNMAKISSYANWTEKMMKIVATSAKGDDEMSE